MHAIAEFEAIQKRSDTPMVYSKIWSSSSAGCYELSARRQQLQLEIRPTATYPSPENLA